MATVRAIRTLALRSVGGVLVTVALAHPAAAAPFAYIPNGQTGAVSIIDLATNLVVATVPVGLGPSGVAANTLGTRVYVLNALDNTVSVIDAATRTVMATVPVGELGGSAAGLALNREATRVYVANTQDNTLSVLDTASDTLLGAPIAVGNGPLGVAVSPSGAFVYVTNSRGESLSIVDTATRLQVAEIPLGSAARGVAVDPAGGAVYAATRDGLVIVDLSNMLTTSVPMPAAFGVVASPDGARVYVTSDDGHALAVVDATTRMVDGAPIDLGSAASAVSITPDGQLIYVTTSPDSVAVIDAATHTVVSTINVASSLGALGNFITDVPPVAYGQSFLMQQNTASAVVLAAADADGDPLAFSVVAGPAHGTLSGIAPNLTYEPAADYGGPDSFTFTANDGVADSESATVSITVPFSTVTSVTSNMNPSSFGQTITLTSTVTSATRMAGGTVQFFDGESLLGSAALSGGRASLTTTPGAGTRSITAAYSPKGPFAPSTSPMLTQTVNKASGTASLTVSVLTPQYSDVETFRTTFTPSVAGGPAPEKVSYKIGSQIIGEASRDPAGSAYQYTWTGQLLDPDGTTTRQMKPDFRVVTATFIDPNFAVTNPPGKAITIQKEDARVAYTGPKSVSFGGSATGTVVLTASVRDISAAIGDPAWDANAGDIRNAQVAFIDRATNTILGLVPVTGSDPRVGTATYNWSVNLGTARSKSYTIGFIVTYYYNRNNVTDNAVVVVSK
jgi:YVTN family beta-propeller protein